MTVLIREELNDADLAWAAADPAVASAVGQLVQARQALVGAGVRTRARTSDESVPLLPSLLRERGAL